MSSIVVAEERLTVELSDGFDEAREGIYVILRRLRAWARLGGAHHLRGGAELLWDAEYLFFRNVEQVHEASRDARQ